MELSHEHMKALQFLSETNLKVSAAKAHLEDLRQDEMRYLVAREKKAMERIKNIQLHG